ncbi:ABC transporter substrate-binding protein [Marinobacter sp. NP-4(2019)]|uniref:substrate-binding periplasmic protein n=1 Tax=Marinobacter sp. NP-4(2019) TaxID=2488665 RepID=UPI000FC3D35E|nr:transporter substrate-binding domain-containing protein [Marinobacter sp. NP-4(2019)]AZT82431.1 ABC transporter substrate-binding protein [Marinobacter sp. NP-4(2019)]
MERGLAVHVTAALVSTLLFALSIPPVWATDNMAREPLVVTVGLNHAPPYRIVDGPEKTGLYVDIFREIANRLGWTLAFREAPFPRVLLMAQQGDVDVMLGPIRTKDREKLLEFVAPAFPPERRLFFYIEEKHRIDRYSDLVGKRIGVLAGSRYFPKFDSDQQLIKESAPRYRNLMLMLEKGRVDVVIAPELVGLYTIRELDLPVAVSPFFVPGERSYIAVSRNSPIMAYVDDIRAALKLIEMEGIHEELVLKYLEQAQP